MNKIWSILCLAFLVMFSSLSFAAEFSRDAKMAVAKASPDAVAAHNKAAWLALFSYKGIVEDPVGAKASQGDSWNWKKLVNDDSQLENFYETFIAPNTIKFNVYQDIVIGNTVIRDVGIETTLSSGIVMVVPVHLMYELKEENGALKIGRLAAHWELPVMVTQVINQGLKGIQTMIDLGMRMLSIQGASGVLGYLQGFTAGIFDDGKPAVASFITASKAKDSAALANLFASTNEGIQFPTGSATLTPASFVAQNPQIVVSDVRSAGFVTSFKFTATVQGIARTGVAFFDFDSTSKKIKKARFFWE